MKTPDYTLYLATDRKLLGRRDMAAVISAAIDAGVTVVQLREKELSAREFFEVGQRLLAVTRRHGVPLIINDRLDIMLALDADGCHLGRGDLPLAVARRLAPGKILGYSVNALEQVAEAVAGGADYIGIGPVFPTGTKSDAGPALGREVLQRITASAGRPCVAIGGISAANAGELRGTGVAGICVISAILAAPDVTAAVRQLRAAFG